MADASATLERKPQINTFALGSLEVAWGAIVFSAATDVYRTGGVPITFVTPAKTPVFLHVYGTVTKTIGYAFDYAAGKLKVYTTLALATEKTDSQALDNTVVVTTDAPNFFGIFKKL